ncbi:MAG TPA: inner membrane CreD family protein [Candidatus Polarisedimenticolaceae bacterium]|nr:inner membrane CreD family protein [Candidatus Polarisedimenticolaceae bacterium]
MGKRMVAIVLIYLAVAIAWFVLAVSVEVRTDQMEGSLKGRVAALWGDTQEQVSPQLTFVWEETVQSTEQVEEKGVKRNVITTSVVKRERPVLLDGSDVNVDLSLAHRRKGLLWYATYVVGFRADYRYVHREPEAGELVLTYRFPTSHATYDDFRFEVAGNGDAKLLPADSERSRMVQHRIAVAPGASIPFSIAYGSRGLDWWRYSFGPDVNRVKDFSLTMNTDFRDIDYPEGTISPDTAEPTSRGWRLRWRSANLISGFDIGMQMPHRLNPGPLAARISFFAPVCLGFFFVWMFVITVMKGIELHPMNYLFLAAAFFAFHLLFTYSVDHLDVPLAFGLSSAVSVLLVVSYLRLVVGPRFATMEAGISQLIYLVLFSFAHFFEGFTGLIVTVGSILTLFALMQLTGRLRWADVLRKPEVVNP